MEPTRTDGAPSSSPDARDAEPPNIAISRVSDRLARPLSETGPRSAPGPGGCSVQGNLIENPEKRGTHPKRENFLTLNAVIDHLCYYYS